ncbi:glycosyltransferase family 2 protein [Hydrogenophaga sp. PAMC20947]|uniref:glycosyltransferase family 2 protein n=1 Tax=Hydrogenophaga sp. PAMC20947 TaxID=2565558 RepID=UPI00109DA24A|nr:glycosyltransferase family 2 protein [Hydrogenophaga sp. PAMC20947]QCB46341.1 glycosyltransferase family 2 protein [Hydrogenophaga sp. PAMC20947]
MKLTILMPCLNEAETLEICIRKANEWLKRTNTDGEVLIADNGSTDGSQEIARGNGARVLNVPDKGYGSALFHGSIEANSEYIIMGDSDDSYDFGNLDPFLEKLDQGFDLVMGNRFLGGIAPGAMPWKNRYIGNPILTWIGRTLFRCPAKDFHCGLRGYRKDAFLCMDLRTTGMEFASEMVIKANLFRMKIAEVPTTLSKDGRTRPPHLRPWRDGWRHLRFMLLFSPRWLFLVPGVSVFLLSAALYFLIYDSPLRLGEMVFDINTLLFAQTGMTLGLIATVLGIIVRMFGMREGLLREHALLERSRASPILEVGGVAGLLLIFAGTYLGIDLVSDWSNRNFGVLLQGELLRSVSLATLLITFGGIIFLASLIMGFLALPTRRIPK